MERTAKLLMLRRALIGMFVGVALGPITIVDGHAGSP
jgi:hypothetical protein